MMGVERGKETRLTNTSNQLVTKMATAADNAGANNSNSGDTSNDGASGLNHFQKKEFFIDIEKCGGPWNNTFANLVNNPAFASKPLYQDKDTNRRLTFLLNHQKQKKAKNYVKFLRAHQVRPSPEVLERAAREKEEAKEKKRTGVVATDSTTTHQQQQQGRNMQAAQAANDEDEESSSSSSSSEESSSSGNDSASVVQGSAGGGQTQKTKKKKQKKKKKKKGKRKQQHQLHGATPPAAAPTVPATRAMSSNAVGNRVPSVVDDISKGVASMQLSQLTPEKSVSRSVASNHASVLLGSPLLSTTTTTTRSKSLGCGTMLKPKLLPIDDRDDFPFANGQFYINRKHVVDSGDAVWQVSIGVSASPTEYKSWSAYSPPSAETLKTMGLEYADYAVRTVMLKGPRLGDFGKKRLKSKESSGKLDPRELRFLQDIEDGDQPQNAFFHWLIVFPEGTIFNNHTSQKELKLDFEKVTLSAGEQYQINKDVSTAWFEWTINEHEEKRLRGGRSQADKETMKSFGW